MTAEEYLALLRERIAAAKEARKPILEISISFADRLLAALDGVLALPHEDYCCTKGCPGFGLATCGKVSKYGDWCDGSECSCFMSGPIAAITKALEGGVK